MDAEKKVEKVVKVKTGKEELKTDLPTVEKKEGLKIKKGKKFAEPVVDVIPEKTEKKAKKEKAAKSVEKKPIDEFVNIANDLSNIIEASVKSKGTLIIHDSLVGKGAMAIIVTPAKKGEFTINTIPATKADFKDFIKFSEEIKLHYRPTDLTSYGQVNGLAHLLDLIYSTMDTSKIKFETL